MKYVILFLIMSNVMFSQKLYPLLTTDYQGDQIVVLTLEQAQKLDNATEFSPKLWRESVVYYKLIDSLCNIKINIKDSEIDSLKFLTDKLKDTLTVANKSNEQLNDRLKISDEQIYYYQQHIEIQEKKEQILKNQIVENEKYISKQNKNINKSIAFGIIAAVISFIVAF